MKSPIPVPSSTYSNLSPICATTTSTAPSNKALTNDAMSSAPVLNRQSVIPTVPSLATTSNVAPVASSGKRCECFYAQFILIDTIVR